MVAVMKIKYDYVRKSNVVEIPWWEEAKHVKNEKSRVPIKMKGSSISQGREET